jgi:hypothetical protein
LKSSRSQTARCRTAAGMEQRQRSSGGRSRTATKGQQKESNDVVYLINFIQLTHKTSVERLRESERRQESNGDWGRATAGSSGGSIRAAASVEEGKESNGSRIRIAAGVKRAEIEQRLEERWQKYSRSWTERQQDSSSGWSTTSCRYKG